MEPPPPKVPPSSKPLDEPMDSTSALLETIIPMIVPTVRKAVSKSLIESGSILRDEEPIERFDENGPEDDLPIGQIIVNIESITVMDKRTVMNDMKRASNFNWPEKDNVDEYMTNKPGTGRQMIVFDLNGFDLVIPLGRGIEYTFPAKLPLGIKTNIEIGCGGSIKEASIRMIIPKMRIWFVNKTRKLYVAFMERPQFTPNLHVNADRGKGDFFDFEFNEEGELDDMVESILAGFGPGFEKKVEQSTYKTKKNWVGDVIGKQISSLVEKAVGSGGHQSALEIDLSQQIQSSINAAFGKPRPVDEIKAHIAILEEELERALKVEDEERQQNNAVKKSVMRRMTSQLNS